MLRQLDDLIPILRLNFGDVIGLNADGREGPWMCLGNCHRLVARLRSHRHRQNECGKSGVDRLVRERAC